MASNPVISAMTDPRELEKYYREDPVMFSREFDLAWRIHPQAQILKFWQARLEYDDIDSGGSKRLDASQLMRLLTLCLGATLLVKLPFLFPIGAEWYYTRFAPAIVISALILYFARPDLRAGPVSYLLGAGIGITLIALLLLPDDPGSSSILMAVIHAPLVMWSLLGLTFTAPDWRHPEVRVEYLKYMGELLIFSALILAGGMVLTLITFGLFGLIAVDIENWYGENVLIAGLVSAPLVASFVYDQVLDRRSRFATVLSNVFTPLFLIMVVAYLLAMALQRQSPYSDREFLILFNGLLLLVLGMTVFSICGRRHDASSWLTDGINLGLIGVTLIINVIALSAMFYRLGEFGISPNRVVVTGANLLIFAHLTQILFAYLAVLRGKAMSGRLSRAIGGFLPVYGGWALTVMVVLPIAFQFE